MKLNIQLGLILGLVIVSGIGCNKKSDDPPAPAQKFLYVSSGACYSGGTLVGTKPYSATSAGQIYKINLQNQHANTLYDYFNYQLGDFPVGITRHDHGKLFVVIENTGVRRLDVLDIGGLEAGTVTAPELYMLLPVATYNSLLRGVAATDDGGYLVPRTNRMDKFAAKARVPSPAPYINGPAGGTCVASANMMGVTVSPSGKIIYTNALANQNRVAVMDPEGYVDSSSCLGSQDSPNLTSAFPTGVVYVNNANQVIVSYSSNTVGFDEIWVYDFNDSNGTFSNGELLYENMAVLRGISAITYDQEANHLYVANGSVALKNNIEKFTYDPSTKTLTRVGTSPWKSATMETQCISSMHIQ